MPSPLDQLHAIIEKHWGYRSLRPLQLEAMTAVLNGQDSLTVLPTGGGKSLCYQAPALVLGAGGGATLVVSPLISLMKDQVDSLTANGIPACSFDSSQSAADRRALHADLDSMRLLFVSPERLLTDSFQSLLRNLNIQRFAIDEAHCVSHWGHDFRPEYRQLGRLKELFPDVSIHAFTATATEHVREDIVAQLHLANPQVLVGNFDRPNLLYRVQARRDLLAQVLEVLERHPKEPGIIYCIRRRDVDDLTVDLVAKGYNALPYHAGLSPEQRKSAQQKFSDEDCDLIVATVAFGMGIDRSNVRFVLHTGMPKSIEHYQQESGRAGRDGLEAECILLYSAQDTLTWKSLIEKSASNAAAEGTTLDPAYIPVALKHLNDMDSYARSPLCRHQSLVEYFGQEYQPPASGAMAVSDGHASPTSLDPSPYPLAPSCLACDLCLNETELVPDATIIAQKILSAVIRTEQRFGVAHIIAVLRGQDLERIRKFRHDQLPTFGIMSDTDERTLRDFIYQLIGQGVLVQENIVSNERSFPILTLNAASIAVLKKQRTVRLVQPIRAKKKAKAARAVEVSMEGIDEHLFEALRVFRRDLARERGVQPYMIFTDLTLRQLARIRPSTMEALHQISGIGEAKLRNLGPRLLPFLTTHCRAANLSMDTTHAPPPPRLEPRPSSSTRPNPQKQLAFKLFASGATLEEVSEQTGRAVSTLTEYLADFITQTRPADISAWVPKATYAQIATVAQKLGPSYLKPIYLALHEQIPYDQIRLVAAHLATRQ